MTPLPDLRLAASSPLDAAPDPPQRRVPRRYLLFNAGGWLVFGIAMVIGVLDVLPWPVTLATQPVYVLIGFSLSLLLGVVYDRLGVGPASFGRTLAIIVAGSYVTGVLWIVAYYFYRHFGAGIGAGVGAIGGLIVGAPLEGALIGGAVGGGAGALTKEDQINLGKPIWR